MNRFNQTAHVEKLIKLANTSFKSVISQSNLLHFFNTNTD